ncbi:MAG TPA: hypothetical protein VE779_08660 [Candidatus Angelobacter sp.]|nr:hypothetical protein [Candidatus Angelobacter sp.]
MLTPLRILHIEATAFLWGLGAVVAYQMFTGQINLQGLLSRKDGSGQTSPERIQLLMATIAAAARYLAGVAQQHSGSVPDIDSNWLYLMGGSSSFYVIHKSWNFFKAAKQLGGKS